MKSRLLVALDESWPESPACAWVLIGPDGCELSSGIDEPQRWPVADSREFLLRGPQVVWLEVAIPRAVRSNLLQVLRYELDEKLIDIDRQHLVITHRRSLEGAKLDRVGVLVVAKERLQLVMAALGGAGHLPGRICAEIQTAPADDRNPHLSVCARSAVLRTNRLSGVSVDIDVLDSLPGFLVQGDDSKFFTAADIVFHLEPGVSPPSLLLEGITTVPAGEGPYLWWRGLTAEAIDLQQGEFARKAMYETARSHLRMPLWIGVGVLAVWMVVGLVQVLWLRHQERLIIEQTAAVFSKAFPNTPVVAPSLQMHRLLDEERSRHGLLRQDDVLIMLDRASAALEPDSLKNVKFEDGRLELILAASASAQAGAIAARLKADGLLAEEHQTANGAQIFVRLDRMP